MNADLIIETSELTKAFGRLLAVDRLDLRVRRGSIHGFVGPNGAGKTTTMKMLIGAINASGGEGYIGGHPIGTVDARKCLGFSPEKPCLYVDMTAWDYLVYMARLGGLNTRAAQMRAGEVLDWLELSEFRKAKVGGFSAGMKQRLSLGQAMAHQPQLLILDEPTANLDPDGRMALIDKLRTLRQEQRITIFVSSHVLPELEQLADTITLIDKGRTLAEGSLRELKQRITLNRYVLRVSKREAVLAGLEGQPGVQRSFLDDDGTICLTTRDWTALQASVAAAVTRAGAEVDYFGREQPRLQDIYRRTLGRDQQDGLPGHV